VTGKGPLAAVESALISGSFRRQPRYPPFAGRRLCVTALRQFCRSCSGAAVVWTAQRHALSSFTTPCAVNLSGDGRISLTEERRHPPLDSL